MEFQNLLRKRSNKEELNYKDGQVIEEDLENELKKFL